MSKTDITIALEGSGKDEALARHLLVVWPVVESILGAFSKATDLPIFVFLNKHMVFQSSLDTMPAFCGVMLNSAETKQRCIADAQRRADKQEPLDDEGNQLCHAGLMNGRREIETGIGRLIVLFGAKRSNEPIAIDRREQLITEISHKDPQVARELRRASSAEITEIDERDLGLMNAISDILERLFNATVGFRSLTINMAHELSVMMLGLGSLIQEMESIISDFKDSPHQQDLMAEIPKTQALIFAQCRLGLYIVRNFLSHASETRYSEVVRPQFKEINLNEILTETLDLHRVAATKKGITFDVNGVGELPDFFGSDMEMRRLLHNILNNAIKYSYHSVAAAHRTIRIRSKVPYDPGFRKQRFSLVFENYGLGLADDEKRNVFKAGFRGQQAISEVPIGSGIGLSEAQKIVQAHKGEIRFNSKELFEGKGRKTYLSTVELILLYSREFRHSYGKLMQ